jgi:hypothetical protein
MIRTTLLIGIVFSALTAFAQRPAPPSLSQANQAETQSQKDMPPPRFQNVKVDSEKLKRDASELASLAGSVPPAIDATMQGMLPKDLNEKLKRIEKLAKELRSQISQ